MSDNSSDYVFVDLTHEKLNVDEIISRVNFPECGAVSVFLGVTRNHHQGRAVLLLEYECYESMARQQLTTIGLEVRERWPSVRKTALVHRLGVVPVGESSVIIAVSSPHRREAMEATAYAIDELKTRVTIWKKEVYESGEPQWKANPECTWAPNVTETLASEITPGQ